MHRFRKGLAAGAAVAALAVAGVAAAQVASPTKLINAKVSGVNAIAITSGGTINSGDFVWMAVAASSSTPSIAISNDPCGDTWQSSTTFTIPSSAELKTFWKISSCTHALSVGSSNEIDLSFSSSGGDKGVSLWKTTGVLTPASSSKEAGSASDTTSGALGSTAPGGGSGMTTASLSSGDLVFVPIYLRADNGYTINSSANGFTDDTGDAGNPFKFQLHVAWMITSGAGAVTYSGNITGGTVISDVFYDAFLSNGGGGGGGSPTNHPANCLLLKVC
jgi:hypothetical protein